MQPRYFPKIPTNLSRIFKNPIPLQTMTIPIIFQTKVITPKLIISTAFLLLSVAIFSISSDNIVAFGFENPNINREFKNQTSLSAKRDQIPVIIPMPGAAAGPESFAFDRRGGGPFTGVSDGRILRWRGNESRWVDFSVTSPERNHVSAIITGDDSGRLMKFDPKAKNATVLLDNLKFPNGVALSRGGDFLLFAETTTCRLYKLWLETAKAGELEFVTEFPGFPDNIKRNANGEFWVGINSRRGKLVEWLISNPWIGESMVRFLPLDITKARTHVARLVGRKGMGVRLDRDGNVVEVLEFSKWKEVSEVHEENGALWIGSVVMPYLVRDNIPISSYLI